MSTSALKSSIRWGDRADMRYVEGVVATSPELFRVETPTPTLWTVWGNVEEGSTLVDPAFVTLILRVGVGSMTAIVEIPIPVLPTPMNFQVQTVAAEKLSGSLRVENNVETPGATGTQAVYLWAAPAVPWWGYGQEVGQ